MDNKQIGERIRMYRNKKGWSMEELSFRAHLSLNTIGRMERGEYTPQIDTLRTIEKALGLPENTLFSSPTPTGVRVLCTKEIEIDLPTDDIPPDGKVIIVVSIQTPCPTGPDQSRQTALQRVKTGQSTYAAE